MDHIRKLATANLIANFGSIFRTLKEMRRIQTETGQIDTLPRDRLEDMGIAPRNKNMQRNSGQYGPLPKAQLW